jgi:hypothetical protein
LYRAFLFRYDIVSALTLFSYEMFSLFSGFSVLYVCIHDGNVCQSQWPYHWRNLYDTTQHHIKLWYVLVIALYIPKKLRFHPVKIMKSQLVYRRKLIQASPVIKYSLKDITPNTWPTSLWLPVGLLYWGAIILKNCILLYPPYQCTCIRGYYGLVVVLLSSCPRSTNCKCWWILFYIWYNLVNENMTIMPVYHHTGHKISPIVLIMVIMLLSMRTSHMDEFRLKLEIQNGHQEVVFGSFFSVKMTHLPHSDYRISPIIYK